jgi:hypothetical protein
MTPDDEHRVDTTCRRCGADVDGGVAMCVELVRRLVDCTHGGRVLYRPQLVEVAVMIVREYDTLARDAPAR